MSQSPRVTVFIPVHNRARYICVAVNSILAQTFEDFELLVVDDGSTDETPEVLAAYDDPRVRVVRNDTNRGIPYTRNRGLELARGEYIALLDSDDHSYPQRLARQVAWLDAHPDVVQVGSWCSFMDGDGNMLDRIRRQPLAPDDIECHLMFHCPIINRTVMARTAALRELGYDESFPRCQDYDMHCRLSDRHRLANLPEILVCGREHAGRFTGRTTELGRDRKMAIQAGRLQRAGIDADDEDLSRHHALARRDLRPDDDATYLDWAEAWLWRIKQANRSSDAYPEPALSRVLGAMWALNCWHSRRALGRRRTLARMSASPLARGIPGNLSARFLWRSLRSAPAAEADETPPAGAHGDAGGPAETTQEPRSRDPGGSRP